MERRDKTSNQPPPLVNMASECWGGGCDTYIPVEFSEGVDHVKPMHVHYGGVDDELGSVGDKS